MTIGFTLTSLTEGGGKGRGFSANVLAYASYGGPLRPIYLLLCGAEEEVRALGENLKLGRKAKLQGPGITSKGRKVEFLKSLGYDWHQSFVPGEQGALTLSAVLPSYFAFQPGMAENWIQYVVMPEHADMDEVLRGKDAEVDDALAHLAQLGYRNETDEENRQRHWGNREVGPRLIWIPERFPLDRNMVALAMIWASYLNERCHLAIPQKMNFRAQILVSALANRIASLPVPDTYSPHCGWGQVGRFSAMVAPGLPMHPGIATSVSSSALADFLAAEIAVFDKVRRPATRRAPAQLQGAA